MVNKSKLRKRIIEKLRISDHKVDHLYNRLFGLRQWQDARSIAMTNSTDLELSTDPLIKRAYYEHKMVLLPRVLPHHRMEFVEVDLNTQFQLSSFGIMEPVTGNVIPKEQIDLIIVPGLAFSELTHDRLGFGGGFYDRYLSHYHGQTISLGLSVQHFKNPVWQVSPYDVKIQTLLFE